MKLQDKLRVKAIIRELARRNGTTTAAVRASMQECIDAAWANPDPAAQARQHTMFPAGKPSVEAFLLRIAGELRRDAS